MTKEEIIEFTKFSGLGMLLEIGGMYKCLEHFAKLVAEKEREAIEKRVMELDETMATRVYVINKAIRERGQE